MNERRRDKRNPLEIPVNVKVGKKTYAGVTANVSFKGVAVKLEEALPLRQLVQLEIEVPGAASPLSGHAMVVHASSGVAGFEFFGRGLGDAWDAFVGAATRSSLAPPAGLSTPPGGVSVPPAAAVRSPTTDPRVHGGPERRRAPRIPLRLEIRLRTPRSIHTAYTTEVSMLSAGVLAQEVVVAIGEPVIVNLIQPGTSFSFRRDGTVRRTTPLDGGWVHLGIEFSPLEPMREVLFADFMNTAYATLGGGP